MPTRLFQPWFLGNLNRFFPGRKVGLRSVLIAGLGALVCSIIYLVTLRVLTYFHSQNELGIILSLKIFQMAWITIFAMLIFSSMVTAVSTLYLSSDWTDAELPMASGRWRRSGQSGQPFRLEQRLRAGAGDLT